MSLLVTLHYLFNHLTKKYKKNTGMHGLCRATILLGRVKHHFDKLRRNEWFKIQVTSLIRVGVREFEICGRGFKVRFAPSSTSTPYSLQNSLSTLLLIVLT